MSVSRSKYLNMYSKIYLKFHQQRMALKVSMPPGNWANQSSGDNLPQMPLPGKY